MASKKSRRGPGRPPLSQTQRVWNAVKRGNQDAKTIARVARVPPEHVHPILNRLRREGRVEGYTGSLRVIEKAEGAPVANDAAESQAP